MLGCGAGEERERAVTGDSAGIKMSLSGDGGPLSMNESVVIIPCVLEVFYNPLSISGSPKK